MKKETRPQVRENRGNIFFAAIVILSFISIIFLCSENMLSHENSFSLTSVDEHEVPEAMQTLAESGNVEWMAGMDVNLINCLSCPENISQSVESYQLDGDTIRAAIVIQNGLNKVQPYILMVFADGAPIKFRVEENTYLSYPFELSGAQELQIDFQPKFSQNLGRLDFLLFYDGNPKSDFHMLSQTMCIEQSKEVQDPEHYLPTVIQREGVEGSYSGWTYGAWLWNEEELPESTHNVGPREITALSTETLLLDAVTGIPGKYRIVVVLDGTPIEITYDDVQYRFLDWVSSENTMLQLPIILQKCNEGCFSFFTIITPLERETLAEPCLASSKIPLTYKEEPWN